MAVVECQRYGALYGHRRVLGGNGGFLLLLLSPRTIVAPSRQHGQ